MRLMEPAEATQAALERSALFVLLLMEQLTAHATLRRHAIRAIFR
jgi:hypothetical protein